MTDTREQRAEKIAPWMLKELIHVVAPQFVEEFKKQKLDIDALRAQVQEMGKLIQQGCPHACTDGNCPFDRRFREVLTAWKKGER